ncbi:DnaJ C-terminal domain-containing protein [Curvibacter sp. APW13]|uniref:DnaJ C-terminal domain-containing protein n=1 Tax=Curvibacter sp. APW13 TaxID=3077236 RepID=UPI0028DE51B1|nr:DnaJ C-terminal domain-containing protein [Curvibacter sp. APW13]MDT8992613.1 DnaJ C-terminal domain-containing protein [Curvibacter sp. APW13]
MDAVTPTHYSVLEVPSTASATDIKRNWRRLARKNHPDVSSSNDADSRMTALNMAYGVLSDPARRAAYDSILSESKNRPKPGHVRRTTADSGWNEGFDFTTSKAKARDPNPLFEQLFTEAMLQRHGPKREDQQPDPQATIELNLRDAYEGGVKTVVVRIAPTSTTDRSTVEQRYQVTIPKGVFEGQRIRLACRGEAGSDAPERDYLLLSVKFKPDRLWRTMGRDVFGGPVLLAPWEAALGVRARVSTPTGAAEVIIPPNWKHGRSLRLKGRGIPGGTANANAGDLYLELAVVLPAAEGVAACEAYAAMSRAFPSFSPRMY